MKKISQILLCAVVCTYISFLCCASPANETSGRRILAKANGFPAFENLGQNQIAEMVDPVLSIEDNAPPMVGSTLTDIYQSVIDDSGTNAEKERFPVHSDSSAMPESSKHDAGSDAVSEKEETEKSEKEKKKKKKKKKKKETSYTEYVLPPELGLRKSLESHTAITSRNSAQYLLQQKATTNSLGLRKYQKRYMVAVGTYFHAPVGTKIDVYLTGGNKLKCIVGDIKSDSDTIGGLTQKLDGSVVEFIVEWRRIDRSCKRLGSMHALEEFDGYVEKVVVYDTKK